MGESVWCVTAGCSLHMYAGGSRAVRGMPRSAQGVVINDGVPLLIAIDRHEAVADRAKRAGAGKSLPHPRGNADLIRRWRSPSRGPRHRTPLHLW
jgi:hypothetical protein